MSASVIVVKAPGRWACGDPAKRRAWAAVVVFSLPRQDHGQVDLRRRRVAELTQLLIHPAQRLLPVIRQQAPGVRVTDHHDPAQ